MSSEPSVTEALTPNHLLLLNAGITFPHGLFNPNVYYAKRRWRQVQYLIDLFWTRWRKEYLVLFQHRQKCVNKERTVNISDLVIVEDVKLPRNIWPNGRVVDVNIDRKGLVRSAKIKTYKGCWFSCVVIIRPVTRLISLLNTDDMK